MRAWLAHEATACRLVYLWIYFPKICFSFAGGRPLPVITPANSNEKSVENISHAHAHHEESDNELIIALSLLFGFLFMLLVDKLASSHHSSRSDVESAPNGAGANGRKVCTATFGLIVHAAADGIALGAAAASHHSDVEFIIFLAIMLHKAPTAFGLTSFLARGGSDSRRIHRLLLIFSAAAPIGAFATFALVNLVSLLFRF